MSVYSPDKPYKVYGREHWYGDGWDAMDDGRGFDFSRPFFEQLKELQLKVPRLTILNANTENSDYCNMCAGNKDCYLLFGGDYNDSVIYGTLCMHNKSSFDLDFSHHNEWCYQLGDSEGCYGCQFVFDSKNCKNSYFLSDCSNCKDCILCTSLNNKSYCIKNKQYNKEEYEQKKKELINGSYKMQQNLWRFFLEMLKERKVKYIHSVSIENSTGDYLKEVKNCRQVFDVAESEDANKGIFIYGSKDTFNCSFVGHGSEYCYGNIACLGSQTTYFSYFTLNCSETFYCDFMLNCQHCFGCVGLNQKKYCILNKQYSKEEYHNLKSKIQKHMMETGEWGQLFPKSMSCYAYNESTAHQYYPLTKAQALKEGFTWKEEDKKDYKKATYQLPDLISDVNEFVSQEVLECKTCSRNYKILDKELKFYRQFNIPPPKICPECRHEERMKLRNPKKLWKRSCASCQKEIQTSYAPERPEKILCEQCYLKNVY